MSWQRGELWLDIDLPWFREWAGAPAVAGLAAASMPSPGPPPGLAASLRRREAWKKRRYARRVRATVLVLSPAVMLPFAPLRNAGGHGADPVADDPPSLTFRIDAAAVAVAAGPVDLKALRESMGVAVPASNAKQVAQSVAREVAAPKIEWNHALSVGLPYGGSLIDGTQLPIDGPDWVTWDPVTDSVPNAPKRLYGNDRTIHAIVSISAAYRAANPGAARIVVGDISREGGGPMTDEHVSHQNGLDVDVYYPRLDGKLLAPAATDEIDRRLAQDLVDRFVAAGAQMIFVGYSTGLDGPSGVVIPYPSHENHMHVRFPRPGG